MCRSIFVAISFSLSCQGYTVGHMVNELCSIFSMTALHEYRVEIICYQQMFLMAESFIVICSYKFKHYSLLNAEHFMY